MSAIEKSILSNLESNPTSENSDKSEKKTTSSGIARLHKGEDELALEYRKTLQKWDAEDLKKIKEGRYEGDPSKWTPRVKSKYVLPLTPESVKKSPASMQEQIHESSKTSSNQKFSPHSQQVPVPKELTISNTEEPMQSQILEPLELDELEELGDVREKKREIRETKETSKEKLDNLIKIFYDNNPYSYNPSIHHEFEVKFGTKDNKDVKKFTRIDYDNVIKKLKSSGFNVIGDSNGQYYLRIFCEFRDNDGQQKLSNVRTEVKGLHTIQDYCKSNDIKSLFTSNPASIEFIQKKQVFIKKDGDSLRVFPADSDDFNFRATYSLEEKVKMGVQNNIMSNWRSEKKEFRFLNRVSFEHNDYPFIIDISISKFGNRRSDKFGRENRGPMIRYYTIDESNVFENAESYEIEIEIDNKKIGPQTKFNTPALIAVALRKTIKIILCGLQQTNYPISYPDQKNIINSYMRLIWNDEFNPSKPVNSRNFIGPNSITLQLKNIAPIDENSNEANVRKDFVVTDKADGERHLLFISEKGEIYLINTNMDVIFTGAKTYNNDCFGALIDGELIKHDKNGKFINLYAAFDIYYFKKKDIRFHKFILLDERDESEDTRFKFLKFIEHNLKLVSILDTGKKEVKGAKELLKSFGKLNDFISPLRFISKEFFPASIKQNIFDGCNKILLKEKEGRFEYNTDGLIFSHALYGVGSQEIGKAGPKVKITWEQSFKWKPPQYNTIDFLVSTLKGSNGDDVIKTFYEDGINNDAAVQHNEYKTIELRCGFKESKDGFINPCQDIIDDKIPEYTPRFDEKQDDDYVPMRFYPTEPYDPNAGLCNIMLRTDGSGGKKMFSLENEVFEDNTIVEFSYNLSKEEGWRWIPLRVRYDKTAKLRRGENEFGNAYKVCNENWKSIHPSGRITEDMLRTGLNIPSIDVSDDIYYNTPAGKFKTDAMKNFHNLYVKKKIITGTCKQGDTLIDFACGKGGDLPKWISAKLSFVFGIDYSPDNLENRLDGACARFLKLKKSNKNVPYALFVNGNSAYNVKDGSAMLNDKAKQITSAIFGNGPKDADKIGKGVARQYGRGSDGFNVSSCQFAIHYFFEKPDILKGFMKNLSECTKHNGYFIGTCYDGKLVFNKLKKTKTGDSIQIIEDDKKIWEITKMYGADSFEDNSSSIGYEIGVYQESINQQISEYLVNFDYLNRVMSAYGFELVSREEAQDMGLPDGSGLFSELFAYMLSEIDKNKFKAKDYEQAPFMTKSEKDISFLNRYFIYKKIRTINTENVELEFGEYEETEALRNAVDTKQAQSVALEEEKKIKPKVRRLTKKLLLVPATEAVDEQKVVMPVAKPAEKLKKSSKPKAIKPLILNNDTDSDEE